MLSRRTLKATPRKKSVVTQFEKRRALSVPKNTGRRGLYKTLFASSSCRGRPFLGWAAVRSLRDQTESLLKNRLKTDANGCMRMDSSSSNSHSP
jgi:hypothetical protein